MSETKLFEECSYLLRHGTIDATIYNSESLHGLCIRETSRDAILLQADTDPRSEGPYKMFRDGVKQEWWIVAQTIGNSLQHVASGLTEAQAITVRNALNRDAERSGR